MPEHDLKVFTDYKRTKRPERPILSKPHKPKAWNHQDDLKSLKGKSVGIEMQNASEVFGVLLEADQFTLKILETNTQSVVTYFKHSLTSFRAV